MVDNNLDYKVCIIGAGLAGTLTALLLSKFENFSIYIYEKRIDYRQDLDVVSTDNNVFGTSLSATKRSINLALSRRGIIALTEVNAIDKIMEHAVRMPCRIIHNINEPEIQQAYGKEDEALWSVGRQFINFTLLDLADNQRNINIYYGYSFSNCTEDGYCTLQGPDNDIIKEQFDLIIGADGAYSSVRESMLKKGRVNFSREFIQHGYKELSIPPIKKNSYIKDNVLICNECDYALSNPFGLHIWPRKEFMLIAIPNPDKSFTATLFAPYKGIGGFDSVDSKNKNEILKYFESYFPDVLPIMPDIVNDYHMNPVGSLVTIRTDPWHLDKCLLIGDAAHAVVPFYGQGMNAAFQDGFMLYHTIKSHLTTTTNSNNDNTNYDNNNDKKVDLRICAKEFSQERMKAANVLADLCLEHYHDMATNTTSTFYLITKKIESILSHMFPTLFIPLYSMIAFSDIPYDIAKAKSLQQNKWIERIIITNISLIGLTMTSGLILYYRNQYLNQEYNI